MDEKFDNLDEAEQKSEDINPQNDLPVFPFVPESIEENQFYVIEGGELTKDEDIQKLITMLWEKSEAIFYYFHNYTSGEQFDPALQNAKYRGDILITKSERRYYKHPNFIRDYVKIVPDGEGHYRWDWEREVVEKGPEFWRATLKLSKRKRDELDAWRKVQMEEYFRQKARNAQYSYDVFLSYSNDDKDAAAELHDKINAAGHKVFMAPKVLKPGDYFEEKIRLALLGSRELWLLVSPSSAKSEWVISEWGAAWALGKRIVPVLHRCAPEFLPSRLAKLHCTDLYRCDELIALLGSSQKVDPDPK